MGEREEWFFFLLWFNLVGWAECENWPKKVIIPKKDNLTGQEIRSDGTSYQLSKQKWQIFHQSVLTDCKVFLNIETLSCQYWQFSKILSHFVTLSLKYWFSELNFLLKIIYLFLSFLSRCYHLKSMSDKQLHWQLISKVFDGLEACHIFDRWACPNINQCNC